MKTPGDPRNGAPLERLAFAATALAEAGVDGFPEHARKLAAALRTRLGGESTDVALAVPALAALGTPEALGAIGTLIEDATARSVDSAYAAAAALAEAATPRAVEVLRRGSVEAKDFGVRETCCAALLRLGDGEIRARLEAAFRPEGAGELRYLARVLGGLRRRRRERPAGFAAWKAARDEEAAGALRSLLEEQNGGLAAYTRLGPNAQGRDEHRHEATGVVFVHLEAARFLMGSPPGEADRGTGEHEHEVWVSPYLIAKDALSEAAWLAGGGDPAVIERAAFRGPRLPVHRVTWVEARELAARLAWTLPTEAQWEYACRGVEEADLEAYRDASRAYAFGAALGPTDAWFDQAWAAGPVPVDDERFRPNGFGLRQMHGNVEEWCHDVFDAAFYRRREARGPDPVAVERSGSRVERGGGWWLDSRWCRSAGRWKYVPGDGWLGQGFRPARSLP